MCGTMSRFMSPQICVERSPRSLCSTPPPPSIHPQETNPMHSKMMIASLLALAVTVSALDESVLWNPSGFIRVQGRAFVDDNCKEFLPNGWNTYEMVLDMFVNDHHCAISIASSPPCACTTPILLHSSQLEPTHDGHCCCCCQW